MIDPRSIFLVLFDFDPTVFFISPPEISFAASVAKEVQPIFSYFISWFLYLLHL